MASTHNITRWLSELNIEHLAPEAMSNLMKRLYPITYRLALRRGLQDADAASVEQIVAHGLFRKLANGSVQATDRGDFFALLTKFARDEIANRFRYNATRPVQLEGILAGGEYEPFDSPLTRWLADNEPTEEEADACNALERRLPAALDDEQLAVYRLRIEGKLAVDEIAKRREKSKETIYRILRSIADRFVTVCEDTELAWLREEQGSTEVQSVRHALGQFLDATWQAVFDEWARGSHPTDIAKSITTTDNRAYRLLHDIDNIVYVLRRQPALETLRNQLRDAQGAETRDALFEIVKKRKWPIFERWVEGQTPVQIAETCKTDVTVVFDALREFHELSRAIRRVP